MQIGPLSENHLKNAVFSNIRKHNKSIKVGAGIGSDFSNLNGIITSDGTGKSPILAWSKALNNFVCSGGKANSARITILLAQKEKQSNVAEYMRSFENYAEKEGIQILGGHSEVLEDLKESRFLVQLIGEEGEYYPDKKAIKPGFDILMAGYAGVAGTNLIIENNRSILNKRFSEHFIEGGKFDENNYSIKNAVDFILENEKIFYLHDVSSGGIFSALWQLGVWTGKGFEVDCRKIKIRQETVEFCEAVDLNPYLIDGTGALLFICERGRYIKRKLEDEELTVEIIGHVSDNKERIVVLNENDRRTLAPNLTSFN